MLPVDLDVVDWVVRLLLIAMACLSMGCVAIRRNWLRPVCLEPSWSFGGGAISRKKSPRRRAKRRWIDERDPMANWPWVLAAWTDLRRL
jgi:hypothetical protein